MMSFHSGQEMLMMIDCVCGNDNNGVCNCACDIDNCVVHINDDGNNIVIIGNVVHDDAVDDGVD